MIWKTGVLIFGRKTILKVKEMNPGITQEVLIPDFNGLRPLIKKYY